MQWPDVWASSNVFNRPPRSRQGGFSVGLGDSAETKKTLSYYGINRTCEREPSLGLLTKIMQTHYSRTALRSPLPLAFEKRSPPPAGLVRWAAPHADLSLHPQPCLSALGRGRRQWAGAMAGAGRWPPPDHPPWECRAWVNSAVQPIDDQNTFAKPLKRNPRAVAPPLYLNTFTDSFSSAGLLPTNLPKNPRPRISQRVAIHP